MATPDTAVDALFAQTGVIRVDTLTELFGTATLLAWQPLPAGSRVAIVGNSGGPETMACDACAGRGLELATISEETADRLRGLVPESVGTAVANPVDLLAGAGPEQVEAAVRSLLDDDGVDALIAVVTPVLDTNAVTYAAGGPRWLRPEEATGLLSLYGIETVPTLHAATAGDAVRRRRADRLPGGAQDRRADAGAQVRRGRRAPRPA